MKRPPQSYGSAGGRSSGAFWPIVGTIVSLGVIIALVVVPAILLPMLDERSERNEEKWKHQFVADQVAEVKAGRRTSVEIYDTPKTDTVLAGLGPVIGLEGIHFGATDVSGAGLRHLVSQPNLKHLAFKGAPEVGRQRHACRGCTSAP